MREYQAKYTGLANGLRPTNRLAVNSEAITISDGGFADIDGFKTLPEIELFIETDTLGETFPFPQIFILRDSVIVCGESTIWEWTGLEFEEKISGLTPCTIWSIADFQEYLLFTNGLMVVERKASNRAYSIVSDEYRPAGYCFTAHKGQLIVAAPLAGLEE